MAQTVGFCKLTKCKGREVDATCKVYPNPLAFVRDDYHFVCPFGCYNVAHKPIKKFKVRVGQQKQRKINL